MRYIACMEWNRRIYGYCERALNDGFWAEPLNALTNGSFIIAGLVALILAVRARRLDGPVIWLTLLCFVVGTGSFLFHTYAMVWAAIMDSVPIMIFILSYFVISMNRFAGFGWGRSAALTLGFLVAMIAASWVLNLLLRDLIGGSVSYVPAMLALFCVGAWLRRGGHSAGKWLISVGLIFAVSLTFRAIDKPLCAQFLIGTHWLWHLLNGVVLGTLTVAVIRHGQAPATR